jgi:hypothetical protein
MRGWMPILPRVLNLLESFRGKKQVQDFLQLKEVPHSGTWETVRDKIERGLKAGKITEEELVLLLEDIEEHGDQYIYLFDLDADKTVRIKTRTDFEALLTPQEREKTLDSVTIIENPQESPILVSSHYNAKRLKLKWVQKRSFRRPLGETIKGDIATVRYQIVSTRAVDIAILDLNPGMATLCVQKIEPGIRDYGKQLKSLFERLARFVDREAFTPLDLRLLMQRINEKSFTEARRRRFRALDANGGLIDVTSATESEDIFSGGLYEAGRANYAGSVVGTYLNTYWIKNPPHLDREIHTIFPYKQASNAVVFTQRVLKTERDHVLSRIKAIAKGQS